MLDLGKLYQQCKNVFPDCTLTLQPGAPSSPWSYQGGALRLAVREAHSEVNPAQYMERMRGMREPELRNHVARDLVSLVTKVLMRD